MKDDRYNYERFPDDFPVAMAYVPWQQWCETYPLDKGYMIGTIFPSLNKPFTEGGKC